MSFIGFVIICILGLIGYYFFIILKPDNDKSRFEEENLAPPDEEVILDEPILVTEEMVTYRSNPSTSNQADDSDNPESSPATTTKQSVDISSPNSYNSPHSAYSEASSEDEVFTEIGNNPFILRGEEKQENEKLFFQFSSILSH